MARVATSKKGGFRDAASSFAPSVTRGERHMPDTMMTTEALAHAALGPVLGARPVDNLPDNPKISYRSLHWGMRVRTDVMDPVYRPWEIVTVEKRLMLKPPHGRDYAFTCEYSDGRREWIVRRLIGETSRSWIVEQYNPKRTYRLPKSQWFGPFRVDYRLCTERTPILDQWDGGEFEMISLEGHFH